MDHAGFIILSYVLAFVASAALARWVVTSGRRIAAELPDEDKPWG